MAEATLKEKTARGLLWGGFSNGVQQLLNLLFGIVLARLLSPSDYGVVGMLTIFSAIAGALQEGGFIAALTNRKDTAHRDFNAVFWFSAMCSISLYAVLFLAAPLIADFYATPELTPLARVVFLGFVISNFSVAPRAFLFKNLKTREIALSSIISLAISGIVGVTFAFCGFAYWAIVAQTLTFVTMVAALNFYFSGWRPSLDITFRPIREMIGFSSKLVITNVFNIFNNNLFSVLLGKFYTEREVGNFTQANKWNSMGYSTVSGMVGAVAQPVLTTLTDDPRRQCNVFRKMLRFTAFVSFPAMLGLSLVSEELITIAITDKWLVSAQMLRLLCVWGAFVPIITLFTNLLVSRGRSTIYMWGIISLGLLQLVAALVAIRYGIDWMIRIFVTINICWLLVWHFFVRREIGLRLRDMLRDIAPYFGLSLVLMLFTGYVTRSFGNIYLSLIAKILIFAVLYALILWRLQSVIFRESIDYLLRRRRP